TIRRSKVKFMLNEAEKLPLKCFTYSQKSNNLAIEMQKHLLLKK
ncbi:MAG: hypothetical protein ACI8WW_000241, partial [Oceanospirillaceae bacterium]